MRTPGQVIWAADTVETATTHRSQSGGGGGSKGGSRGGGTVTSTTTVYSYSKSFAIGFCGGVMAGVRRIWANKKLILDLTGQTPDYASGTLLNVHGAGEVRFYPGTRTQEPDSLMVAAKGAMTPAFRDLCYLVFDTLQLADYGNGLPQIEAELVELVNDDWRTTLEAPVLEADGVTAYNPARPTFGGFRAFGGGGAGDDLGAPVISVSGGPQSITTTWDAVSGALSYTLWIGNQEFTEYEEWPDVTSPHVVDGLEAATTYYVKVRASNAGGDGPFSNIDSDTTS